MSDSAGLAVGATAPNFTAPLVPPEGDTERVALDDLLADGPVLLCFYTNDFSPDCVSEWCSFRDYDWFASGDQVQVVGVSKSSEFTHRKFIDHLDLGFPLYADRGLDVAEAFRVKYRAFKVAPRSRRSCFLLDADRTVRYKWVGEHPLDPTRDTPPVTEVHAALVDELGLGETDSFGFS